MKEKILKLLNSKDLDNILLAVQLGYNLPFNEFDNIFCFKEVNLKTPPLYYEFKRKQERYILGSWYLGRIGHKDVSEDTSEKPEDLTPEHYNRLEDE